MNSLPNVLLAIAPGKRELGIAVFAGADLIYASVKTIRQRKSQRRALEEVSAILQKLFQSFSVGAVVVKSITQYQKLSPGLEMIFDQIRLEAMSKGLPFAEVTIEEIKSALCKDKKVTEKNAFETLLAIFPELEKYWNRPNKWQNDYYAFLFSAVAIGIIYLKKYSK